MAELRPRLEASLPVPTDSLDSPESSSEPVEHAQIAALFREHFRFLWRSLRRLGVRDASVDDAVQDVFLVAHRKLAEFEGRSSHRVWLFAIALRVAAEHRRRDARLRLDEPCAEVASRGEEALEQTRRVELLYRLLDDLSDPQREVFVMAEIEGFTAPEIAEALGEKLNTVYSRLRLARRHFERALARTRRDRAGMSP